MPSVSPIKKSPITKYLQNNKFHAVEGEKIHFCRSNYRYFYGEKGDYLGEMIIHPKGRFECEISKLIFEEKLKPIFREYTRIKTKMGDFWNKEIPDPDKDKFLPIAYVTERVTIDFKNKTQTKQVIKRVLEKEPALIKDVKEKYGIEAYELENQTFKYKIDSVTEETKPYKWSKYQKYNIYV